VARCLGCGKRRRKRWPPFRRWQQQRHPPHRSLLPLTPEEASGQDKPSTTPAVSTASANGATYYVGQTGCSDAGPGDDQDPFCSFATALSHLAPGDTLIVKNGVYSDQLAVDGLAGTLDAPILIRGESRDGVILDGGCLSFPCSVNDVNWEQNWEGMVKVTNSDHLTISDLTARNDIGFGIMVNGGISMTIKNTLIEGTGNGGLIVQSDPVAPQVTDNEVRRTNMGWRDESGSLHDGDHEAISIIRASDFVVANNYVHDVFEEGIDIKESSTNGEVRDNFVERACSVGIYINEADDVRIYRNQVRRSGYFLASGNQEQLCSDYPDLGRLYGRYFGDAILLAVGDLGELSQGRLSGIQVYQNVVWDAHGNGLQFWDQLKESGTGSGTMTGNRVYNNVFYNTALGGIRLDDIEDTMVVNNIVALNDEEGITGNATTDNTVSHNLFFFRIRLAATGGHRLRDRRSPVCRSGQRQVSLAREQPGHRQWAGHGPAIRGQRPRHRRPRIWPAFSR